MFGHHPDSPGGQLLAHMREQVLVAFTAKPGEYVTHLVFSTIDEPLKRLALSDIIPADVLVTDPNSSLTTPLSVGTQLTLTDEERIALRAAVHRAMTGKHYEDAFATEPTWTTDYCAYVGTPGFDPVEFISRIQRYFELLLPQSRIELVTCLCGSTAFDYCEMAQTRLAESRAS